MRTVQLTFTFTEDEWEKLRRCALLLGAKATYGDVTNSIKILALEAADTNITQFEMLQKEAGERE